MPDTEVATRADWLIEAHPPASSSLGEETLSWRSAWKDEGSRMEDESTTPPSAIRHLPSAILLLIADNAELRDHVQQLLSEHYEIALVADRQAMFEAMRKHPFELVLADVTLLKGNGFELLRELRAAPATLEAPVILLSAQTDEEMCVTGLEAGADDYLVEPFSARVLLARVAAHLRLKRQHTQTQAALRMSEERYRLLARAAAQVVITADATGANTDSGSDWWEQLTGQPMSESSNHGWTKCLHPDDYEMTLALWLKSLAAQTRFELEFRARKRDGAYGWLHATGAPIHNADGSFREWVIALRDISERKQAEASLRENQERERARAEELAALMDAVPAAVWIAHDADCRKITGSRLSAELLRMPPDANLSVSAPAGEQPTHFKVFKNGVELRPNELPVQMAARGVEVRDFEEEIVFDDGEQRSLYGHAVPLRDSQGKVRGAISAFVDITERKQAEADAQLLAELSERIRLAADAEELLSETARLVGEYLQVNRCFFSEMDLANDRGVIRHDYYRDRPSVAGEYKVSDYSSATRAELMAGRLFINCDAQTDPRTAAWYETTYQPAGERAYVGVPLLREDRLVGVFCVSTDQPRVWQPRETALLVTVGERVWLAVEKLRLNQVVRESEERYRALVQASAQAVWHINEAGMSEEFHRWWQAFTGQTLAEETGLGWLDAVHPDEREQKRLVWARVSKHKAPYEMTYRIRRHDGAYRWFTVRGVPVFNADGSFREWIGTLTDVHEQEMQKRDARFLSDLSEQLRVSEDAHELMQAVVQAVGEHLQASRCHFAEVDEAADCWTVHCEYSQTQPLTGQHRLSDYGPEILAWLRSGRMLNICDTASHPLTANTYEAGFAPLGIRAFVTVPLLRDGGWTANLVVCAEVGRDWQPREIALLETVAERTWVAVEKLRLNVALRESEERLRAILQNTAGLVFLVSADHRFLHVNRQFEELFKLKNEEVRGKSFYDYFPAEVAAAWEANNRQVIAARTPVEFEESVPQPDGLHTYNSIKAPLFDETGAVRGIVGISYDITERKQVEVERERLLVQAEAARVTAEAATRAKDEFIALVSHELRSPLNAILGWNRMLRAQRGADPEIARITETIERAGRAQLQLVEDLLDTARVISGKLKLNVGPVELNRVVEAALDTLHPAADARGLTLIPLLDPQPVPITGDPDRLQQVVWNLVSNAIKFTPAGGRVTVEVRRTFGGIEIIVSDTGRGISPELLPHLFERLRQGDPGSSQRTGGLGLGLALVKYLVELHGGSVYVESPGEGLGATFTVTLLQAVEPGEEPLATELLCALPQEPTLPEGAHSLAGLRLLIVDDDETARDLLVFTLSQCGASVVEVDSGAAALTELTAQASFDLLVSDIGMPDMSGCELLRQVRTHPDERLRRLPAVALSAFARTEDRLNALAAGFQMHLAKPVELEELTTVIASLTGRLGSK